MTSPPREVTVECPECGHTYEDFVRDSINTNIEPWTPEEIEEAMTTQCPRCGHRTDPAIITMTLREEGEGPDEEG